MGIGLSKERNRGAELSKERMLYDCVRTGDIASIRSLHGRGASLNVYIYIYIRILQLFLRLILISSSQWVSNSGKTPLILACSLPDRFHVIQTLLELGANVNYYNPSQLLSLSPNLPICHTSSLIKYVYRCCR